ncbi:uncharacterized protein V6R79_021391 [Siganus canaliculatus]
MDEPSPSQRVCFTQTSARYIRVRERQRLTDRLQHRRLKKEHKAKEQEKHEGIPKPTEKMPTIRAAVTRKYQEVVDNDLAVLDEGHRSLSAPSEEAILEADTHTLGEPHLLHSRSAPQLKAHPLAEEDGDSRANLSELLARLISSRKGSVRRNSTANSRGSANHRIADRDYLGWMDFGRRSAEEYEYSS